jgi:hypothetical protein
VLEVVTSILFLIDSEERCCDDESSKQIKTECGLGVRFQTGDEVSSMPQVQSDTGLSLGHVHLGICRKYRAVEPWLLLEDTCSKCEGRLEGLCSIGVEYVMCKPFSEYWRDLANAGQMVMIYS